MKYMVETRRGEMPCPSYRSAIAVAATCEPPVLLKSKDGSVLAFRTAGMREIKPIRQPD